MNYYIADLHLFCKSQTKAGANYDGRPFETVEEMNQHFLERWNVKVTNADTVYILGDISLRGRNNALIGFVSQLRGRKVLIKGNHDSVDDYRYRQLFAEITDYKEICDTFGGKSYKLVLCHYPILMWNGQHRGTMLLYGHTHNGAEETYFQKCISGMNASEELSLRRHGGEHIVAINVGASLPWMDYEPRTLKEILARRSRTTQGGDKPRREVREKKLKDFLEEGVES